MKTLAYLDCPTGIAGDMCLGALVDMGVPLSYLSEQLAHLPMAAEFSLRAERVVRQGQTGTKVWVDLSSDPAEQAHAHSGTAAHSRHLPEIEALIQQAALPARAIAWSLAIFRQLAVAEAAVHGIDINQVHFHEVGATDAIVDIVGTCLGLDWLDIDALYCSALPTGGGFIRAAHGQLPVPAPAVLKLFELGQVPIYSNGIQKELVTPTGAAIAVTLATGFGTPPPMQLQKVGLGAGGHDLPIPNLLRLWLGKAALEMPAVATASRAAQPAASEPEAIAAYSGAVEETVIKLQTQVDDLSPQAVGFLFERLLSVGALDVFSQPAGMKKSRPGLLLTVICLPAQVAACETVLFEETTTLGIRRSVQSRDRLPRTLETLETPYGPIAVKTARHAQTGQLLNVQPEYEDCAQAAQTHKLPWQTVCREVLQQWYRDRKGSPN
ncbi:nickel pincer cofactor biosynthesis protein LarC [Sphaerothrix gracilis]|uniref:nickel pincer cofactor biosynthesis protein LarC n=1 Tax=Sphaerothrix gracilis TaxID=3151835 RepID=UPI0031FCDC7C